MFKKGQITLFIIIAVVIVAVILITYFTVFRETKVQTETKALAIKNYVEDSIEKRALIDILTVSYQGGYAFAPEDSFPTPFYQIAYWVEKNETFYPSIEEIAANIDFLNTIMGDINLSQAFPDFEISQGTLESNTTILSEKIKVSIKWPITIKKGDIIQKLENFNFEYNIRLGKIYDVATYVAESVANETLPTNIPPDMNLTIYTYENASLYEIIDTNENFKINDQYYRFVFAGK
ncbi:MAG: hypothetical protein QW484_01870 [Candidatus Pacearchaeota archaeon]